LGSAALTGAGHSFTRFDQKFADGKVAVEGDWIDVKYGPEIGYRETVKIEPDFAVTLNFDHQVAISDHGQISLTNSFKGKWSDLPGIALLGDEPVTVSVSFDGVTGKQTKRGVFYLTDYLELTLVEVEELKLLDALKFELPALYSARTSLFGNLLGEAELEVTNLSQGITQFGVNTGLLGTSTFQLSPIPSTLVYVARSGDDFNTSPNAWRELATHTAPASLQNAVLVIASGASSAQVVSDLRPERIDDEGATLNTVTNVAGLVIPESSSLRQSGARSWSLPRIVNDGQYQLVDRGITRINGLVLSISGQGAMRFDGTLEVSAAALFHGPGHTMSLGNPRTIWGEQHQLSAQQFDNAGQIAMETGFTTLTATQRFNNTGGIVVTGGQASLATPVLVNDGLIEARGATAMITVDHPAGSGQMNIQSTMGTGQFIADQGATLVFSNVVLLDTQGVKANPVRLEATNGGTIRFDHALRAFDAGVAELHVDETSKMILNGIEVRRQDAQVSLVNKGLIEVQSGTNRAYFTPIFLHPNEPPPAGAEIKGINVVNEGTIRIQPRAGTDFALFGYQAEIVNYVPGGATLGPGTWELIGQVPTNPYKNDKGASADFNLQEAILEILIARVSNDETYLGRIDFGDTNGDGVPDGYSAEDYDTSLAVSEANVLLSGAARFDYFNTIRENRGAFTLRNKNHFDTVGDLVNKGAVRIESDSRLNVVGDFTVDEGTVFVDSTSILDVKSPNTLEVVGGTLTVERGAVPLFVNTPWIVREKWLGIDEQGNDIVREARVSYGGAWFPTIGPNADILVEGRHAVFEPLSGLNRIEGKLTLAGGNELHLAQSLTNPGTLALTKAGKLYVDGNLNSSGQLQIGADAYLDVAGALSATAGSIQLGGIVHTAGLSLGPATVLTVDIAGLGSASQHTQFIVDGQAMLGGGLQTTLGGYIPSSADTLTILSAAGGLTGSFTNIATGERLNTSDGIGSFLVHYGSGSAFDPNRIVLTEFEPTGDYNGDGNFDTADYVLWRKHDGTQGGYNAWRTNFGRNGGVNSNVSGFDTNVVPEPTTLLLLIIGMVAMRYR
jgi:hypothetical protein